MGKTMHKVWLFVSLIAVLPSLACAQTDLFDWSPSFDSQRFKTLDRTIDPDRSVYGLSFGSSEKDLISTFGEPTGVIVLNETRKAYLYGRSHLFVFRNGKLRELFVQRNILDWDVSKRMDEHPFFDRGLWILEPGIENNMDFNAVMDALGRPHANPDYRYSVEGERSSTELTFSRRRGLPGAESFVLYGIAVTYYGE